MDHKDQVSTRPVRAERGFTLTELIVVLALLTVLSAISIPPFVQWISNAKYRASARNIMSILRETKSKAITSNLEHRVEFESNNRRYRVQRGNRSSNSNDWGTVIYDWTIFPSGVNMNANVATIHLNPNGTASGGTIAIQNAISKTMFEVRIASTGRIRISKGL
jgi:prepilin-type N-terminal cleavage/methylation domain-containing protein